jgi:hypothetical protein
VTGSNYDGFFDPQLTSYDYDAPLTEAGDPTDKYSAIRAAVNNVNCFKIKLPILLICVNFLVSGSGAV